jgi:hypothetical protein
VCTPVDGEHDGVVSSYRDHQTVSEPHLVGDLLVQLSEGALVACHVVRGAGVQVPRQILGNAGVHGLDVGMSSL